MTADEMKIIDLKKRIRDCADPKERAWLEHCLIRKQKRFRRKVRRNIREAVRRGTGKGGGDNANAEHD